MHAIRFWHHSPLMGGTAVETVTLLCTQGRASSERLMWNASATTICILSYRVTGCLLHRPAATQHAHRTRTGARIERRTVIRPNPVSVEPRKTLGLGSPKPRDLHPCFCEGPSLLQTGARLGAPGRHPRPGRSPRECANHTMIPHRRR